MRAGTEFDNLLEVAQFIGNEADDGRHPEAVRGWDKYKTYFTFDGENFFEGEISIELIKRGDLFYDITKIKDTSIARAAGTANDGSSSASNRDVFNNSISQTVGNVNPSDKSDSRTSVGLSNICYTFAIKIIGKVLVRRLPVEWRQKIACPFCFAKDI